MNIQSGRSLRKSRDCSQTDAFKSLVGLFCTTFRNQAYSFLAELDLKVVARLEVQHRCVGLAYQQISIALNGRYVAQLASAFADTSSAACQR